MEIYPFEKKIIPLTVFTLIYIIAIGVISWYFAQNTDELRESIGPGVFLNQISIFIGIVLGTGFWWRMHYKEGLG